jgi:peptidoglycan-associated lipoprotein
MKPIKFTNVLVLGLVLTLAATGCHKKTGFITPLPKGAAATGEKSDIGSSGTLGGGAGSEGAVTGSTTGIASNPAGSHQGWAEDPAALKAETLYFALDSSVVRPEEKSKVAAVADYLKSNPAAAVRIEGNCDERGTAEYNRALGERRALAVREELAALAIDPTRVDTISYGFDRPAVQGHDESSWGKNRRDEFVVLTSPK